MNPYVVFLLYLVAILGFVARHAAAEPRARARSRWPRAIKLEPFECGATPVDTRNVKAVPIKYYAVAIVFILFDLETVFLFIWALGAQPLTGFMLVTFFIFIVPAGADPALRLQGAAARSGDGIAHVHARTIPIRAGGATQVAGLRVPHDQEGRAGRLGAQVLAVPVPVRHRLLRDGVHGGELVAVRHRPLRRRAAALLAAPGRPADGRGHGHAQAGADPAQGLRADVRAQVGDGLRRLRDAAAASTRTTRRCRASTRSSRSTSTSPAARRGPRW